MRKETALSASLGILNRKPSAPAALTTSRLTADRPDRASIGNARPTVINGQSRWCRRVERTGRAGADNCGSRLGSRSRSCVSRLFPERQRNRATLPAELLGELRDPTVEPCRPRLGIHARLRSPAFSVASRRFCTLNSSCIARCAARLSWDEAARRELERFVAACASSSSRSRDG
jgi:hypothetical protein